MSLPNRKVLQEQYETDSQLYQVILQEMVHRFKPALEETGLHPTIKTRVKAFKSYFEKFIRKLRSGEAPGQVKIHDVLGLRVVCPFIEDIARVEEFIRTNYTILEEDHKGAVQSFKEFGYESTHFLVALPEDLAETLALDDPPPVEIQVRTILQDAWAEVEHELIYKAKFFPFDQPLKRKLAALNANLTLSDIIFQEIREYQRQLSRELEKRKANFLDKLRNLPLPEADLSPGLTLEDNHPTLENMDQMLLDALFAHNNKEIKKAINYYSSILKLNPKTYVQSLILVHRGMAYYTEGLFENALDDFDQAIVKDPQNSKAFYYRGVVELALERCTRALEDFNQSLHLVPFQVDSLLGRGQTLLKLGRYDEAKADCEQALDIHPEDFHALELYKLILEAKQADRNPKG